MAAWVLSGKTLPEIGFLTSLFPFRVSLSVLVRTVWGLPGRPSDHPVSKTLLVSALLAPRGSSSCVRRRVYSRRRDLLWDPRAGDDGQPDLRVVESSQKPSCFLSLQAPLNASLLFTHAAYSY